MEEQASYLHPDKLNVDSILNQAVTEMSSELEEMRLGILQQVLTERRPDLAGLSLQEQGSQLTAYAFGPGHTLVVETESGEPLVYFQPAETKLVDGHMTAIMNYLAGHAGAREFYRIRARYHVMD